MPRQKCLWKGFLHHFGEIVTLPHCWGSVNSRLHHVKKQVFIYVIIDNGVISCLVLGFFVIGSRLPFSWHAQKITTLACAIWLELGSLLGLAFMVIHHCRVYFECSAEIIVKLSQHPPNVRMITVRSAAMQGINYSLSLLHILGIKGAHLCAGACAKNVPVNWVWNIRKQR